MDFLCILEAACALVTVSSDTSFSLFPAAATKYAKNKNKAYFFKVKENMGLGLRTLCAPRFCFVCWGTNIFLKVGPQQNVESKLLCSRMTAIVPAAEGETENWIWQYSIRKTHCAKDNIYLLLSTCMQRASSAQIVTVSANFLLRQNISSAYFSEEFQNRHDYSAISVFPIQFFCCNSLLTPYPANSSDRYVLETIAKVRQSKSFFC